MFDKRKKILIPYVYNTNWIGGTYYIENLLRALGKNRDFYQSYQVHILADEKSFRHLLRNTKVPLTRASVSLYHKAIKKIFSTLNPDWYFKRYDLVFPYGINKKQKLSKTRICWIPDFQEKYYPSFFSKEELSKRNRTQKSISLHERNVVFSSKNALDDFNRFYPENTCNKFVLNFAVSHPTERIASREKVTEKFSITGNYFICSNQFWVHKNHDVVLDALFEIKKVNPDVTVIFTGKEFDYRDEFCTKRIKQKALTLGLERNLKFLGFIDRSDQLALMKHSIAVIQPSLFEGWSTVVEDAKSLSKKVICSDLKVHREQLGDKGEFFDPADPVALGELLLHGQDEGVVEIDYGYKSSIEKFASDFLAIIEQVFSHQMDCEG